MACQDRNTEKGGSHAEGEIREAARGGCIRRPSLLSFIPVEPGPASARSRPFLFLIALAAAALAAAGGAQGPPAALAHGGPPLRIGTAATPGAEALGRLILSHLRDGVGFAVDWKPYTDEGELRRALSGGKVDIAVGWGAAAAGPRGTAADPDALRRECRERCDAELFFLAPSAAVAPAGAIGVAVARGVLSDLRFTILGREIERLLAALTARDLAAVNEAAQRGERAAAAAARSVLAGKALR